MKMVYFKLVQDIINFAGLMEVIIDVIVRYHGFSDLIVTNWGLLFTSKFWSLLCYFLGIKQKLSTAFNLQTDGQPERQNSRIKAYIYTYIKFKQNYWAWLLSMTEFAYHNTRNASTNDTFFMFNCRYHLRIFYEEDLNLCSNSKSAEKLSSELRKLMTIYQ